MLAVCEARLESICILEVSAKLNCRVCTVSKLPHHFIFRVEYLPNAYRIKLTRVVPGKLLLFEGLGDAHSDGLSAGELSLYYWSCVQGLMQPPSSSKQ